MMQNERRGEGLSKDGGAARSRRWWAWPALLGVLALSAVATGVIAEDAPPAASGPSPDSAGPAYKSASEQEQLELLRRLLGVAAPAPKPAPVPVPEPPAVEAPAPAPEAVPVKVEPPAAPQPVQEKTAPERSPVKPEVARKPKAVAKPKPAPKPVVKPKAPAKRTPEPRVQEAAQPAPPAEPAETGGAEVKDNETKSAAAERAPAAPAVATSDVPPVGTIVNAQNAERWDKVLTPSVRWSVGHGTKLEVVESKPIVMEPARAEATERYHSQVTLTKDKKGMLNHVAGIPFPGVTESDPDAAIKLMFNFEQRIVLDDVDGRNFACVTGPIDVVRGVMPERNYRVGHFTRLFYTGRLLVDPKPVWKTPENLRYRERLGLLSEPFDLKGAGFTYNRYLDPSRQDDSWLYLPQSKRVRRLSTAQRSEGVFGQDVDLDSYAGFAGNPAWFDWQLLGKKTLLLPLRAKHQPVKWGDKPADFLFDDVWEPRETYIIAARSLLPGYNFSLRVIYVDAESFIIPITEVYDHNGQLWRAYIQQTKTDSNKAMPYAKDAVYDFNTFFVAAVTVFDLQQQHATACEFPAPDAPTEETWYYWRGEENVRPEDFDVAGFIQAGR